MPPDKGQCCVTGCIAKVSYKCDDCHHHAYFCGPHLVQTHQGKLHVPCSYEEPWYPKGDHDCESVQTHNIVVVDYKGRQHDIPVAFCNCESEATQLVRMGLWPASAVKPQVAFSVDLMRWLTVMSLECHVALRNLCQALSWMVPKTLPILTGGKRILSLDAMFGLKRWKKSGSSELPPKYVDSFFLEQNVVDDFVQSYHHQATSKQNCSTFQAGDLMQSKNKSKKIDETGVFGSVCRHEMPISFFSLRQGEQLSNAVYMVQHLLKELPNTQHYILYDIACMLEAHLKKSGQHALLSKIKLAVPAFHIYGHKPSCQAVNTAKEELAEAMSSHQQGSEPITETMIRRWRVELTSTQVSPSVLTTSGADMSTNEAYAIQLSTYYDMCDELTGHTDTGDHLHNQLIARKLKSIHEQLLGVESGPRWSRDGDDLKKYLQINEDRARLAILQELHSLTVDRWFLLHLKRRYADGQKIAKRLCLEINKVSTAIKKLLHKFCNRTFKTSSDRYPNILTLDDILDVKSPIWDCLCRDVPTKENVPRYGKCLLVDALLKVDHSCQEVSMLEAEMKQVTLSIAKAIRDMRFMIFFGTEHPGESIFLTYKLREMQHFSYYIYTLFSQVVELDHVEEPSIIRVIDLQDRQIVHEDIDLEVVPTEDDEGAYLDQLIVDAENASEHSDSD
ncbi:hypothetical protein BSL78_18289 [Apostichopus japonicus]|uniref:CxC2-like cysteine cluster KDZ transposase-associated domain-containing protein n=1 Tax=Stichopus japonicus TaxID=307972 RepID=A0A2G8KA08_STIJA|nr:hypothetical protein BSL78_18289 [Apostichopus japonicus]